MIYWHVYLQSAQRENMSLTKKPSPGTGQARPVQKNGWQESSNTFIIHALPVRLCPFYILSSCFYYWRNVKWKTVLLEAVHSCKVETKQEYVLTQHLFKQDLLQSFGRSFMSPLTWWQIHCSRSAPQNWWQCQAEILFASFLIDSNQVESPCKGTAAFSSFLWITLVRSWAAPVEQRKSPHLVQRRQWKKSLMGYITALWNNSVSGPVRKSLFLDPLKQWQ